MNVFAATNFTDDSGDVALQSSGVDEVVASTADDSVADSNADSNADSAADSNANSNADSAADQTGDSKNTGDSSANTESTNDPSTENTKTQMPSFGNGTSFGNMSFGNMSFGNMSFGNGTGMNMNFSGMNFSNMSMDDFMDIIKKFTGGDDNNTATNDTNETVVPVDTEVSDVPKVATSTSYAPASQAPVEKSAQHSIIRLKDNVTVSTGDALRLEGVNKLFDSDFSNGHLLVYVDGKLVFNEITSGDSSTPIFWISDDYVGQHQISVEFTPDGNSDTNRYSEGVLIL